MPLDDEILNAWSGYLPSKVRVTGRAAPYFSALRGLLERIKAGRRFSDLNASEKGAISACVERIAETSETAL